LSLSKILRFKRKKSAKWYFICGILCDENSIPLSNLSAELSKWLNSSTRHFTSTVPVKICPLCYPTQFALIAHFTSSGF
jgi:hypothetical protein